MYILRVCNTCVCVSACLIERETVLILQIHMFSCIHSDRFWSCVYTVCMSLYIHVCMYNMCTYMYVYVAVPRQGSMSAASANAVLSGHCNRFVGRS